MKPVTHSEPVITGGLWTEDDFSDLARLMAKFVTNVICSNIAMFLIYKVLEEQLKIDF